jgi:hypothetical protein
MAELTMRPRACGAAARAGWTLLWLLLLASGCSRCGGKRVVPFKHGVAAGTADAGRATAAASSARAGTAYPTGTSGVELAGQRFELPAGSVRAALDVDLDGDGSPDGLLVTEDAAGVPSVQSVRRNATGWDASRLIGALAAPAERCNVGTAALELLDTSYALVRVELACGNPDPASVPAAGAPQPGEPSPPDPPPPSPPPPPATAPPAAAPSSAPSAAPPAPGMPPPPAAAAATVAAAPGAAPAPAAPTLHPAAQAIVPYARRTLWVVGLGPAPTVLERIVLPGSNDATSPKLDVSLRAGDLDGDGHSDLHVGFDVNAPELASTHVDVRLWNRAGGLARDRNEPEQTLLALADEAKNARKRKPASAGQLARQALVAYGALCRESGSARLGFDGGQGLECGASLAAGRAGSILAAVLATEGKLLQALERYETLRSPDMRLTENDWERVQSALATRVEHNSFSWREGPAVALPPGSLARLSVIAFLDERRVLLRGRSPRSYDVSSGSAEPIGVHGATLIIDPSARFALVGVTRSCEGPKLSIVRVAQVLEGVVAGPPVSEPLITAAAVAPGMPCPPSGPQPRDEPGGFRPLAWTAQGVLLARGAQLWLLALDQSAHAAAPAQLLAAGAALPALGYSGEVSSDGRLHALITPLGIALLERASGRARLIALPEGSSAAPSELALSPSGKAIAIVRGGKLYVATASALSPPAAMPAPAPAQTPPAVPKSPVREPPPAP